MDERDPYLEKIFDYLNGQLTPNEMKNFDKEIDSDPQLKEDVFQHKKLLAGIKSTGDRKLKNDISITAEKLKKQGFFEDNSTEKGKTLNLFPIRRILSIAAGLALMIGIGWWVFSAEKMTNDTLFANYYSPEKTAVKQQIKDLESTGMVPGESADDILRDALLLYNGGRFEEGLSSLQFFSENHPDNKIAKFYLALSKLHYGKYKGASKTLKRLASDQDFVLKDEAKWYHALTLLKIPKKKEQSLKIFEEITASDSKRAADAQTILKKLK